MKYSEIQRLISQPRLNRYLAACSNSKIKAKKLYNVNLRLSQAFYPILNLFEIILRNEIHYRLSSFFSTPDWIITEKTGFMNDRSLRRSNYFLKKQVIKAERKLGRTRRTITSGKVIAEQSLGFWTALFEPHHYRLIRGNVIGCFPNKPSLVNRSTIFVKLQRIRDFRNRVYHNEPVCFNGNIVDFTQAENVKKDIMDLLLWISPTSKEYVKIYDNVDSKIDIGKRI